MVKKSLKKAKDNTFKKRKLKKKINPKYQKKERNLKKINRINSENKIIENNNKGVKNKQIYNSICHIINLKNNKNCTGFFMQISLENNIYYFLITSNDIIKNEDFDNNETISVNFSSNEKEERRLIQINASNRSNFHFYNPLDVILIEILDSDNISKDRFLYPDLNYKKGISLYVNKSFKIAGFEKNNNSIKKFIRRCKIKDMYHFQFIHNINKGPESSGSIIYSNINNNVIGVTKGGIENNLGAFIGPVLDKLDNIRRNIDVSRKASQYVGTLSYFLRHGKGICYYDEGGVYEGDWVNDLKEGKGKMYYSNGNIYDGEWKNDRREGIGTFYFCKGGIYIGEFKNNIIDGFGRIKCSNLLFTGNIKITQLDNPNFDVYNYFNMN